jgi:hypothetical protein
LHIETFLLSWVLRLGAALLQVILSAVLDDPAFCKSLRADARACLGPMRSKGRASVEVQSLFGAVSLKTTHWVQDLTGRPGPARKTRRGGGTGVYPVLWQLGISDRATPGLQAEVSRAMALCSSAAEASDLLGSRGLVLSPKQVCAMAYGVGQRALNARAVRLGGDAHALAALPPDLIDGAATTFAGRRVAVAVDGGRYRARLTSRTGRRTAKKRKGFQTPWKEPKGFVIYALNADGKPDRAINAICDFITGNAEEVSALLTQYLRAYGACEAKEVVFLADGAHWIWKRVGEITAALGFVDKGVKVTEVLDFYHAVEHLAEVAKLPQGWTDRQRQQWLKKQRKALKKGEVKAVQAAVAELRPQVSKAEQPQRERVQGYLSGENEGRMRYGDYKAQKLPRGSGAIESAIRRVINQRVKSNATFWKPQNAEVVMHMRAQLKTGRFFEMIRYATIPCPRSAP